MPNKKELVYPFFLECIQYSQDSFWENIFEQLAFGYPIYGTFINKGFLCCSYKNKEFSYKIERKEPKVLYTEIYQLFTEKLGVLSKKQKIQKKLQFEDLEKNIQDTRLEWITIRKKNVKDILYEKFVLDNKEKYSLTWQQSKYLLSMIMLSMIFKTITSKDIIYKNGKIEHVNGFEFKKNDIAFNKNLCNSSNNIEKEEQHEEPKLMSNNWNKYLNILEDCLI
jgi:hypothetical protein